MSGRRESEKMNDPFLRNYDDAEVGIAAEFLSNWLPFLSRGLCKSCTQTLSDGVRSLHTGNFAASSTPDDIHPNGCNEDEGNCTAHSGGSTKDGPHSDDCADMHSVGSWKDEDDMNFEPTVEASPTTPIASSVSKKSWADIAQEDELAAEEENEMSGRRMNADDYSTPMNEVKAEAENEMSRRRINGDDCSVERTPMDEVKAVEENEMSSRRINADDCSVEGTPTNEVKAKVALSRDQREDIRFNNVQRKKDFVLVERIEGKQVNILDGLELHKGVFSAAEQKRIVDYVEQLRVMGSNGQLKDRTYTAPQKWMRGKGRITLQFGCCYNYATDKNRNPPGILRKEMVDPLPQLFKVMIKRLIRWCVLPPSCVPDSCIVNIYEEGDCIPPHIDNHDFLRPFCTVSFLSECEILFGSNLKILGPGEFAGSYAIPLPVGSVLVINGNGADVAKHCVPAVPSKRISITFRKMDELKRPSGYVPEPDLQGLQPLSDDSDRSKKDDSASRARRLMGNPTLAGSEDRVNRGRGIGSGPLWARHLDSYRSGRSSQGPADRRRPRLDLEN